MILTFMNSVFQNGFFGYPYRHMIFFLLAPVILYLQKRDAVHEFESENFFLFIF